MPINEIKKDGELSDNKLDQTVNKNPEKQTPPKSREMQNGSSSRLKESASKVSEHLRDNHSSIDVDRPHKKEALDKQANPKSNSMPKVTQKPEIRKPESKPEVSAQKQKNPERSSSPKKNEMPKAIQKSEVRKAESKPDISAQKQKSPEKQATSKTHEMPKAAQKADVKKPEEKPEVSVKKQKNPEKQAASKTHEMPKAAQKTDVKKPEEKPEVSAQKQKNPEQSTPKAYEMPKTVQKKEFNKPEDKAEAQAKEGKESKNLSASDINKNDNIPENNTNVEKNEVGNSTDKKFEDYSTSELMDMARDNPEQAAALNADFRERYEADELGMSQEEYQDYKYKIDAANSKADMDENVDVSDSLESSNIDKKVGSIDDKFHDFEAEFQGGFKDTMSEKKALGANISSINEIKECRNEIDAEKGKVEKRISELKEQNPYYDRTNNQEYKELIGRYEKLESQDKKLSAYESTLDGQNYAMCEDLNSKCKDDKDKVSYCQQTEKYRYGEPGQSEDYYSFENQYTRKLDSVDKYANELDTKLKEDSTQPLDKFQLDFQKSRVEDTLSSVKENGSPAEKERAEALSARFDSAQKELDEKYKDYKLYDDGTMQHEVKTHSDGKSIRHIDTTDNPEYDKNGNEVVKKKDVAVGSHDTLSKSESLLYTGEDTGKRSKETSYDVLKAKAETTKTGMNEFGEKVVDKKSAEFNAGHVEAKANLDVNRGKASVEGSASAARFKAEHMHQEGDKKESTSFEANAGKAEAAVKFDGANLSASATAKTSVLEGKAKHELDADGHKTTFSAEGSLFGASTKVGFDKYGVTAKAEVHRGTGEVAVSQDGVKVLSKSADMQTGEGEERKPDKAEIKYSENKNLQDGLSGVEKATDLKANWDRNERQDKMPEKEEVKNATAPITNQEITSQINKQELGGDGKDNKSDIVAKLKESVSSESSSISKHLHDNNGEIGSIAKHDFETANNKREISSEVSKNLSSFEQSNWDKLSDLEKEHAVEKLRDCIAEDLKIENRPNIAYYNKDDPGDYGGYASSNNTIYINRYNMGDAKETADTIAHESRHCWQHERAENPQTEQDYQFKENFENYVRPEDDFRAYKNQIIESDARAYASDVTNLIPENDFVSKTENQFFYDSRVEGSNETDRGPPDVDEANTKTVNDLPDDFESKIIGDDYSTKIDDKVKEVEKERLPGSVTASFKDKQFRTVVTTEPITVYRVYGGDAKLQGAYTTTEPCGNKEKARENLALKKAWKNTMEKEATIEIPAGTKLNIGKVGEQTENGKKLSGGSDQILLPQNWDLSWVKSTRDTK